MKLLELCQAVLCTRGLCGLQGRVLLVVAVEGEQVPMPALDGVHHLAFLRLAHPVENAPLFPLLFAKRDFGQWNHM